MTVALATPEAMNAFARRQVLRQLPGAKRAPSQSATQATAATATGNTHAAQLPRNVRWTPGPVNILRASPTANAPAVRASTVRHASQLGRRGVITAATKR